MSGFLVREHQAQSTRAHPVGSASGNPGENTLLPDTLAEFTRLGISPHEIALDGRFQRGPTCEALARFMSERVFIAGRQQPVPNAAYNAIAPEPRAGSVTSSAATDYAEAR